MSFSIISRSGNFHEFDVPRAYTSDEEDGTARPRKGTTGPAQKQKQTQNGDTPRAPPPVQPHPSQTQALKSKLVNKKRGKKQEEDIFADTSSSSTPGPPRRPPTAIVRVEEGAFRNTIKRPRESAGDSNWPPKRRKNSITNAATVQQQEGQKQVQVNGKANISHQQVEVVIAKPKPHAPPAVASSSKTRLEDIPPPPRPPSPPRYRPEVNGKTYAARRSNESYQMSNAHINGDNEVHGKPLSDHIFWHLLNLFRFLFLHVLQHELVLPIRYLKTRQHVLQKISHLSSTSQNSSNRAGR